MIIELSGGLILDHFAVLEGHTGQIVDCVDIFSFVQPSQYGFSVFAVMQFFSLGKLVG